MSAACERARRMVATLQGCRSTAQAREQLAERGERITSDGMTGLFARHRECCGLGAPSSYLAGAGYASANVSGLFEADDYEPPFRDTLPGVSPAVQFPTTPVPPPPPAPATRAGATSDERQRIYEAIKRGPVSFAALCDALDMSPAKARKAIEDARAAGLRVDVEHDHVGIKPTTFDENVQDIGIPCVVGERQNVGVISDLHLGSKYCLRAQMREFIEYAYHERGVRNILCPGDVLDGMYKHGVWELSHVGLDEQTTDLIETLPQLPGLRYHSITGNHDETFEDANGISVGPYIENRFKQAGRDDIRFYGRRAAFVRVGGAIIHLWHPRGSAAYAKSYRLQKIIEKYASGTKPHALLVGHFHQYCHLYDRGIHAFLCPTFQGGGSAFGNSLGGAPTIGGMVLSWTMTEGGTMRSFAHEYRAYFEAERLHEADDAAWLKTA